MLERRSTICWNKLQGGNPEATGIPSNLVSSEATRIVIARHEWIDLSKQNLHGGTPDFVANRGDSGSRYDEGQGYERECV